MNEPYPGYTAEVQAHAARQQALREASADPLPGPLAGAFAPTHPTIAGLTVRAVVHADFVILKKLNSPILATLTGRKPKLAAAAHPQSALTDDSTYDLIYQFTRPCPDVEREVDKLGPKDFRARARMAIGYSLGPVEVLLLAKAIEAEFTRAFSTLIGYEPKTPADGSFTTPPPTPTASAGGSTTCAV